MAAFKSLLASEAKIPENQQVLELGGRELDDSKTLEASGVKDDEVLP